jgi:hypothetical protein
MRAQVDVEEGEDPPPGVLGGVMVVTRAEERDQLTEDRAGVETVEEAVPGVRILLDVVVDPEVVQDSIKPGSPTFQRAILAAVAADHRTGTGEPRTGVPWDLAVVDRRGGVAAR